MTFAIRQAKTPDAEAISRLIIGLSPYFFAEPASPDVKHFLDTLAPGPTATRIAAPNFSYYVAEGSTGLCGVAALRDDSHLYHLFVHPDAHRQGIARALWQHVLEHSSSSTYTVNSSLFAVPVYEHLGFVAKSAPVSKDGLLFVPMVYGHDS